MRTSKIKRDAAGRIAEIHESYSNPEKSADALAGIAESVKYLAEAIGPHLGERWNEMSSATR